MKRRLIRIAAIGAALCLSTAAIALASETTVVRIGNLVLKIEGGLAPQVLPSSRLVPVTLNVNGSIGTADSSQPPALKEVIFDSDRNAVIDARGLPTCHRGQLEARTSVQAKQACADALVGRGTGTVRVAFAESEPFDASGPLLIFNGGEKHGVITIYIHVYVDVPAPDAVVTTLKARREHDGRYGTHSVTSIPLIAGGAGAVTDFRFALHREFSYEGRRRGFLEARCQGAHFAALATFKFRDGEELEGEFTRPCQPEAR